MIKLIDDTNIFLEICDKIKEVKCCELKESVLYNYMITGLYGQHIFTYADYDKQLNGCVVFAVQEDIKKDTIIHIIFLWIDKHYPKLLKQFQNIIEDKAKEFKVKKICFTVKDNTPAVERKAARDGYKKTYYIYEKEMV